MENEFINLKNLRILILFCFLSMFPQFILGDVIYLENGDIIKGKIIQHNPGSVKIKTKYMELTIAKKQIMRIKITRESKDNKNTIKRIAGVLISQNKKYLIIKTEEGKIIKILKKNLEIHEPKKKIKLKKPKPEIKIKTRRIISIQPLTSADIRWNSIWRSALLPSWGQFYQKKYTKAWIIAGAGLASITGYLISYFDYRETLNQWNSGNHSQAITDELQRKVKPLNILTVITTAVWLLNIADAAMFSPDRINSKKMSVAFTDSFKENHLGIYFKIKL